MPRIRHSSVYINSLSALPLPPTFESSHLYSPHEVSSLKKDSWFLSVMASIFSISDKNACEKRRWRQSRVPPLYSGTPCRMRRVLPSPPALSDTRLPSRTRTHFGRWTHPIRNLLRDFNCFRSLEPEVGTRFFLNIPVGLFPRSGDQRVSWVPFVCVRASSAADFKIRLKPSKRGVLGRNR